MGSEAGYLDGLADSEKVLIEPHVADWATIRKSKQERMGRARGCIHVLL